MGALFYGFPGVVLGSLAVIFGLRARKHIKQSNGYLGGGGMVLAGWIVGVIGILGGALWALFLFALYMAMVGSGTGAGKG